MLRIRLNCGRCGCQTSVVVEDLPSGRRCCVKCNAVLAEIEPIAGSVYVFSNAAYANMVKIGFTTRPVHDRVEEVSNGTGVPMPFVCEAYWFSQRPAEEEKALHELFRQERVSGNREFFRLSSQDAVRRISQFLARHPEGRTPTEIQATPGAEHGTGLRSLVRHTSNSYVNVGWDSSSRDELLNTPYHGQPVKKPSSQPPSRPFDLDFDDKYPNLGGFGSNPHR